MNFNISILNKFLTENNIAATTFGRQVAGDPRLVLDIRLGRVPRKAMVDKITAEMEKVNDLSNKK